MEAEKGEGTRPAGAPAKFSLISKKITLSSYCPLDTRLPDAYLKETS
jgi:hypothetical protein